MKTNKANTNINILNLKPLVLSALVLALALIVVAIALAAGGTTVLAGANGTIAASGLPTQVVARGAEFQITLRIENNTGFAGIPLRMVIPEHLTLTGITVGPAPNLDSDFNTGFRDMNNIHRDFPAHGPGHAFANWGRSSNFTLANTELVTYSFRVADNAPFGPTGNIAVSFHNILGQADNPVDIDGNISITLANGGVIGHVTVGIPENGYNGPPPPPPGYSIEYTALTRHSALFYQKHLNISFPEGASFDDYLLVIQYRTTQGINMMQILPADASVSIFLPDNPALDFIGIDVWLSAGIPSGISGNFAPLVVPVVERMIVANLP